MLSGFFVALRMIFYLNKSALWPCSSRNSSKVTSPSPSSKVQRRDTRSRPNCTRNVGPTMIIEFLLFELRDFSLSWLTLNWRFFSWSRLIPNSKLHSPHVPWSLAPLFFVQHPKSWHMCPQAEVLHVFPGMLAMQRQLLPKHVRETIYSRGMIFGLCFKFPGSETAIWNHCSVPKHGLIQDYRITQTQRWSSLSRLVYLNEAP